MTTQSLVYPGQVDWAGENPGMYLKEQPDGPFVTLASFFRIVLSPHGRGHALVLMQSPLQEQAPAAAPNICLHDNEPLARYLVSDFVANFGAFKGTPGLKGLVYKPLTGVSAGGDPHSTYVEAVKSAEYDIRLSWEGLGEPFALMLPPDKSATGKHTMISLFVGAERGIITLNGKRLAGQPWPREIAGRTIKNAFLAFAETWIKAA
jgi:hypothetical protein